MLIQLGNIKNEQLEILVSNPTNPSSFEMSSYFEVCLVVDTMTTDCDKNFGKVVFPAAATSTASTPTSPDVASLSTPVGVGQAQTYRFNFDLSTSYSTHNSIRVTFPPGYRTSSTPHCEMKGVFNQVIKTFVWPDDRTIECQNISKTLGSGEELKIIGMTNPHFAGTFGNTADGWKLEVMDGVTTIIHE